MYALLIKKARIEDILAAAFTVWLLAIAGASVAIRQFRFDEEHYWELSFILAPLALLVFLSSLRYAIHGGKMWLSRSLTAIAEAVRDWSPFLCFLLAYEAFRLQIWGIVLPQDRDAFLMSVDRYLFGQTPSIALQSIANPVLTDILSMAYFSHLILPPVLAYVFYLQDKFQFRRFLLTVLLSGFIGFIGYLCVPAVGPGIAFGKEYQVDLQGNVSTSLLSFVDVARAPRDVFPSLHVAIACIVLWFSRRLSKVWFLLFLPIVLANCFSTIYLRYHYLIDDIAGVVVAMAAIRLSTMLLNWERRWAVDN